MLSKGRAALRQFLLKRSLIVVRLNRGYRPSKLPVSRTRHRGRAEAAAWTIIPWSRAGSKSLQVALSLSKYIRLLPREKLDSILDSPRPRRALNHALAELYRGTETKSRNAISTLVAHDTSLIFKSDETIGALASASRERVSVVIRDPLQVSLSSYNHLLYNLTQPSLYTFSALGLPWGMFEVESDVSMRPERDRQNLATLMPELITYHRENFTHDKAILISKPLISRLASEVSGSLDVFPSSVISDKNMLRHFLPDVFSEEDIDAICRMAPANDSLSRFLEANPLSLRVRTRSYQIRWIQPPGLIGNRGELQVPLSESPATAHAVVNGRWLSRPVLPSISIAEAGSAPADDLALILEWLRVNVKALLALFTRNTMAISQLLEPYVANDVDEVLSEVDREAMLEDVAWLVAEFPDYLGDWGASVFEAHFRT